jgi:hypothetical protein
VPSIAHYIVQAQAMADGTAAALRKRRALPANVKVRTTPGCCGSCHGGVASVREADRCLPTRVQPPVFKLGGAAIGNGFTDAVEQTLVQVR